MKQLAAYLVLLIWLPLAALAQDEEKGGLEGLLERSLSSDAMQVTIDGLSGALSSTAVIEKLTFTDATGPWMVIEDAELNWTRSALLRGRVSVAELAAGRISVLRAPVGEEQPTELPSAEAQPFQFSLPELPVSIEIERLSANEIVLEEPLLGERVVAVLEGGFRLADGDGAINLNLRRTDIVGTTLELGASFENESEELVVVLDAQAREGGLLARKTSIPGAPALDLSVVGRGLLSDFTADVTFATADATRLGGVVRLLASDIAEGATSPDRTIQAQLSGDVRPLVTDDLQSFFGDSTAIDFETILAASGKIEVPRLHLRTRQLTLRSRLALSETMWPEQIALFARLDAEPGQPVRLPVPGTPTELSSAYLNFSFDLNAGSIWSAVVTVSDLQQGEMELETLDLRGAGELTLPEADGAGAVSGQLNGGLVGIVLPEANLQQAAGDTISFGTGFAWRNGEPLEIDGAQVAAGDVALTLEGLFSNLAAGVDFAGAIGLDAPDLRRFSGLAGQDLTGAVALDVDGQATLLSGIFDLDVTGTGTNLQTGIAEADAVLGGTADLAFSGARTTDGITIRAASVQTQALDLQVEGGGSRAATDLTLSARLDELSRILPELSGPMELSGTVRSEGDGFRVDTEVGASDVALTLGGLFSNLNDGVDFDGDITLDARDLSRFSAITGQALSGDIALDVEGQATLMSLLFDLEVQGEGSNLRTGIPQADAVLGGAFALSISGARDTDGITIRQTSLTTEALDVQISGTGNTAESDLKLSARLDNLARLVPEFPGPTDFSGTVRNSGDTFTIDGSGSGPAGLALSVAGTLQSDFSTADLAVSGSTRLAIANPFINPRTASGGLSFDIAVQGPLGLDAVNGIVTLSDARVADPTIGFSLEQLAGTARLANNAVNLDFQGNGNRGGQIALGGSLGLTGSQIAALVVDINALRLSVQGALQSRVNGRVALDGPLAGGATLSGVINLDETELRIPDGGGAAGTIRGLRHVGTPGPVRVTLDRAGMLDDDKDESASSGSGAGAPALNLDLLINAPRQIFVRGFGLDAELGGSIKVTGTTSAPRPVGEIELQRGRMSILGQRLDLTEGAIQLTASIIPDIRFVASNDSDEYQVSAVIEGPADEPEVTFEATPSLPEDEVLSRLLFRSDVASLSPLQAIQLANSLIAVRNGSGLGFFNQLREEAGLDDLDLRTDEEGRTSLSLGKYISDDVYTNVDINEEGETDVNLNIELTDSVTGRATAGTDNSSLGLFFERDY